MFSSRLLGAPALTSWHRYLGIFGFELNERFASYQNKHAKVWLNGTAGSPLIYDFRWGGVVTCGCAYKKGHGCTNGIGPHECPGLSDPGMNFGLGFYNDHHFHFGETCEQSRALVW